MRALRAGGTGLGRSGRVGLDVPGHGNDSDGNLVGARISCAARRLRNPEMAVDFAHREDFAL